MTMNPVETIAIAKLVNEAAEKNARKSLASGTYSADFWLHITGCMDIGEDYTRRVPQKAKPWELLAVALSHLNGVTIESITREALNAAPELVESVKAKAEASIRAIKGTTETVCSGRIDADLAVEVVPGSVVLPKAA
jgi:hypothetical protein